MNHLNCRPIKEGDVPHLIKYFGGLSASTKSYYGPHTFDEPTLSAICDENHEGHRAFVTMHAGQVVGYAVVKKGYTKGEQYRFPKYDIDMDTEHYYLFAPSIADAYQSKGVGSTMLVFIERHLRKIGGTHLILWGGVQMRNARAIRYYEKNGFVKLGQFHHEGLDNWDMAKTLVF